MMMRMLQFPKQIHHRAASTTNTTATNQRILATRSDTGGSNASNNNNNNHHHRIGSCVRRGANLCSAAAAVPTNGIIASTKALRSPVIGGTTMQHRHYASSIRTMMSSTVPTPIEDIIPTNTTTNNNNEDVEPTTPPTTDSSGMDDEYGTLTSDGQTYTHPIPFPLESGHHLPNATLRYMTYGTLNETKDNVLVVCHALTGNASLHSWWGDLLGPGKVFDTDRYFVVCANLLGSCYGSSGPVSVDPDKEGGSSEEEGVYGINFPDVSVRDSVSLQLCLLKDHLKLTSVKAVIGGSFGGMQAVEFAAQAGVVDISSSSSSNKDGSAPPPFIRSVIPIACGASHTAWQIAVGEAQRQAIYADPKWRGGKPRVDDPAEMGLSVARQIGMITYRTSVGYENKFGRGIRNEGGDDDDDDDGEGKGYGSNTKWEVKSYLNYQGTKFLTRFDPITYVKLTEQMDSHDVGRNRGGKAAALSGVNIPALVLGIDSDVLYPLGEQEELAGLFPQGRLGVVRSDAGHDGFLLEGGQVSKFLGEFLDGVD